MPPRQRARNLGSNYTTFRYRGKSIAYLERVQDTGQNPVGQRSPQPIHPLGYDHPIEFVTPRALDAGSLTLSIRELWNEAIWEQMAGLAGTKDILGIFRALAAQPNYVSCAKIINPPSGRRYGKTYHRCVIANIQDGESFDIGTMSEPKTVTIFYTHTSPL